MFSVIFETALLAAAVSMDTFVAFFAYGSRKIRVPFAASGMVCLLCTGILTASAALGRLVSPILPQGAARLVCFILLFLIGTARVFDAALKVWIRRGRAANRRMKFKAMGLHFLLEIYADPEIADLDDGGSLSPREAALLAAALSLDGAAAGFGVGAGNAPTALIAASSLLFCAAAVVSGLKLGGFIADRTAADISPVGGILLIVLAFLKL